MPTMRPTAVALFLLVLPTLVWPQEAVPDKPSCPAHEQENQQSGGTGDSATQLDAATQPRPQTAGPTPPAPDPTPGDQKIDNLEGKQTKRMFWIIPNFAAVSADTL